MATPHTLDDLLRWTDSGGLWQLVEAHRGHVVIDLVTCTGDEVVGRIDSTDPALVSYVTGSVATGDDPAADRQDGDP